MLPLCLCALLAATPARAEAGLYLFGRLSTAAHSLRALLLRSTDGGVHWTEVLPEEEHREVLFLEFEGCEGRALVGWSTEGPGELTLYASSDCGAAWKPRSTVPKAVWSEWPVAMNWKSDRQGTVWLEDMNGEKPVARVLTTRDGGRTWSVAMNPSPQPSTQPTESRLEAQAPSGVRWKVTVDDQVTRVERHEQGAPVQIRALLPRYWRREGTKLVPTR